MSMSVLSETEVAKLNALTLWAPTTAIAPLDMFLAEALNVKMLTSAWKKTVDVKVVAKTALEATPVLAPKDLFSETMDFHVVSKSLQKRIGPYQRLLDQGHSA